jgi:spermidine/putrescine transport system ATP-binding protein
MKGSTIDIASIEKNFGPFRALEKIELSVKAGEFVSLLGASGCGKTTLLRIIAGLERPSGGRILLDGKDVTPDAPEKRPTSLVFQRGALFPHMSVRENVGYSLKLRGWTRPRIAEQVDRMLSLVRLEGFGDRNPGQLSGGQVQRVALARALAFEPGVLLLDEPLSALDLKLRQEMQLELRTLQRTLGSTFIFVTHDQTEALVMSDRIAIMNGGRMIQCGTPQEIYRRPSSVFVADFIGQANLLAGHVAGPAPGGVRFRLRNGMEIEARATQQLTPGTSATLSVRPESMDVLTGGEEMLFSESSPPGNRLAGTVREAVFMGPRLRTLVDLGGGVQLWAERREEEGKGLAPGENVLVLWPVSAGLVLTEGETS